MSRLIESIRCEDGVLQLSAYHQERVERAFADLFDGYRAWNFREIIRIPENLKGVYKCRVVYDQFTYQVDFMPYRIRPVSSLKIVSANNIEYAHKYEDRNAIDRAFALRESCDDILILQNGYLTDASYTNLAFFDGKIWYTPSTPLLAGVRRQFLLDSGKIQTAEIRKEDLPSFTRVSLINAMIDLDQLTVPVSRILG